MYFVKMNSLKTIFDKQIEQFRDLKVKFNQIKHDQESFNYDWKLSDLEQEKDKSLEEVEKNEILSDSVKKAACDAIEYEFLGKLEKLEAEYAKFWELLATVLSERRELRSDPKYQEAMKVRSMTLHAKLNTEKLKWDRDYANDQVAAAKERFEQVKKALELAEQELEWSKKTLTSAKEALKSSTEAQKKLEAHYNEKIKNVILIQEQIINKVIDFITNGLDINEEDLTRSLDSIVKSKIYYSSWIWPMWGWIEDIKSMVSIEPFDYTSLKAWDSIFVACTFWEWEDKLTDKLNIRIVWGTTKDTSDNAKAPENTNEAPEKNTLGNAEWNPVTDVNKSESGEIETSDSDKMSTDSENIEGTVGEQEDSNEESNTSESTKKGKTKGKRKMTKREKELQAELNETTEMIKQYILNNNNNNNKIPFICFLKWGLEKSPVDEEIWVLLERLATIYLNYHKDIDCLNLILNMNLQIEIMQKFIEYAHERSVEHWYNHKEFEDMKKLIQKLTDLKNNPNTPKKDKKDIWLQILGYIGTAFGVNMEVELRIADIWKSGHILAWKCDGNAKRRWRKK